jgi:hypothetical protein
LNSLPQRINSLTPNKRTENPEYKRLTFALLGVATPSDLISDKNRTPFLVWRVFDISGQKAVLN